MKTAVVTGAGGFIGKALVQELSKNRIKTIAISGKKIEEENCRSIDLSLEDIEKLPGLLEEPADVFYHLAWKGMAGTELRMPEVQLENCSYLIKCMRAAASSGCKKFIGAGSISQFEGEYDKSHAIGDKERYYRCCKNLCERYGTELAQELGISFIWPVITSAYGPTGKNPERLIYSMIAALRRQEDMDMSEGKQIFDFVYVKDVAKAFRLIGEKGMAGRRYVIGSGTAKPLREWLEPMPTILGSNGKLNFGKRPFNGSYMDKRYFDISELIKDTEYEPETNFETGIQFTAEGLSSAI